MRDLFYSYFNFNRKERNGALVLVVIVVLLMATNFLLHFYPQNKPSLSLQHYPLSATAHPHYTKKQVAYSTLRSKTGITTPEKLYPFNPNTIGLEELLRFGLSPKTAHTLIHFRKAGGGFRKKEDLKKIYSLPLQDYLRLEPYIQLPEEKLTHTIHTTETKSRTSFPKNIELNEADSAALIDLKGIGPVLSRRIMAYRKKLGGFYSKEQLKEVYGLSDSTFQLITGQLTINPELIALIHINTITAEGLKKHPYIRYYLVKGIINYRQKHGAFNTAEDLEKTGLFTKAELQKLLPYISFSVE